MDEHRALLDDVSSHRMVTEVRLQRLLKRAQIDAPVDLIEFLVLTYHHTRLGTFCSQMRGMFASAGAPVDKDALTFVLNDLWHYFPHSSLGGKSPAEIVDAGQTLGRSKTKPTRRANRSAA